MKIIHIITCWTVSLTCVKYIWRHHRKDVGSSSIWTRWGDKMADACRIKFLYK